MKIGIDTFACDSGKSGIGLCLKEFLKRIPPSGANYELFGWEYDRFIYSEDAPALDFVPQCFVKGTTANSLWHIFKYPEFASSRSYNACLFPAAHRRLPNSSPCPTIGIVHDMAAYYGTRKTRRRLGAVIRMMLPSALRRLDRVIAVSNFVKQELVELAGVNENRIEVIPNGIDHSIFYPRPINDEAVVLIQPFSFNRPYILYTSRIDHPIKNHVTLIKAFGIFKERTKFPHRLVLAGAEAHSAEKVRETAEASAYKGDIFFTGHFPLKSLPELYSAADMAVFPSMYEGFGMGVLEAMASGVPVACARAASLLEAAEHAALYFDPLDAEDMADRMVSLATDRELASNCRRLGLERVKEFSWDRSAERILALILETAGGVSWPYRASPES